MENGARLEQWTWPWTPSTSWCVRIIVIRTERSNEQKRKMNDAPCPPLTSHGAPINGDSQPLVPVRLMKSCVAWQHDLLDPEMLTETLEPALTFVDALLVRPCRPR
jgi:hypothetical protein